MVVVVAVGGTRCDGENRPSTQQEVAREVTRKEAPLRECVGQNSWLTEIVFVCLIRGSGAAISVHEDIGVIEKCSNVIPATDVMIVSV